MALTIVEFEVVRDYLGVAADATEVDQVSILHNAIDARIKVICRRGFEGDEGATYTEIYRLDGAAEFTLRHVPVEAITSVTRVWFDGTRDDAYTADLYRIEDAERGVVRLGASSISSRAILEFGHSIIRPRLVEVVYRVTGAIPFEAAQAELDWCKARWDARDDRADLVGYTTGQDSETYSVVLAGLPPRDVALALAGITHGGGGGGPV